MLPKRPVLVCKVFPAHAGMNRRHLAERPDSASVVFPAHAGMNRPRGWSDSGVPLVFPAHAGMNRPGGSSQRAICGGVPRARGDEPSSARVDRRNVLDVFPAHAGMNRVPWQRLCTRG